MNEEYRISDLYLTAYLRAKWYECRVEKISFNKFFFIFPIEAKKEVDNYISHSIDYNVNANKIVSEIKLLKSYMSNNS